jgi:uncharacterized protein (TIGR03086 family)
MTDVDVREQHRRASGTFGAYVHQVKDDQWGAPTPCADWTVRDLVNHVVNEARWTSPLLAGRTVAEVGDAFDGDLLGDDPTAAWDDAGAEATAAVDEPGAMERTTHLSFGDVPAPEYIRQLVADHLIHGWDLARAIGADDRLDPELVNAVAAWFTGMEQIYRSGGAVGPRPTTTGDGGPQAELLAAFGRSADWTP